MSSLQNTVYIFKILILRLIYAKQVKYVEKLYCSLNDKNTLPYIFFYIPIYKKHHILPLILYYLTVICMQEQVMCYSQSSMKQMAMKALIRL